jgi:Protein of unknown function (DUF2769)
MERPQAEKICICPDCPTYVECGDRHAFCMYESGKSTCIETERGCICSGCPVHDANGFEYGYYCTHGSEAVQAG